MIDYQSDSAGESYFANSGRVRAIGSEVGLVFRSDLIQGDLNYGYQAASSRATDQRMTNSPSHLVSGSLSGGFHGLRATWTQRIESGRLTVYGTETKPFTVANLTLRKTHLYRDADLFLQVRNVLDERYATPGGFEHRQATLPQDGRSWSVRVEWAF
ncbi:MAG: TonB-dependent receptor [Planctomycetota bacterium]|nr:TonB-dependent receptor [Planctomycetota bacterium]